jgi:hypothetical protein
MDMELERRRLLVGFCISKENMACHPTENPESSS